jgi:cytidylate kinase
MSDVTKRFAIIFVAVPGSGKTSVAEMIVSMNPDLDLVCIEQDKFYNGVTSDNEAYLVAVERTVKKHNVILCKNHHTVSSLQEVLSIMKRNGVPYVICNFIADNMASMTKDELNAYMDILLDRIEGRTDGSSHLVINETKSRARARTIIKHVFLKQYEEPEEPCMKIDYLLPVETNAELITKHVRKEFIGTINKK